MDRNNKVDQCDGQYVDDTIDWCLQELSYSAQERIKWNEMVKEASGT